MGSRLNRSGDALELVDFDWRWGKPYLASELAGGVHALAIHAAAPDEDA